MRKKTMIIVSSITFSLIAVLAVLFIASGIFSNPQYLEPWKKTYSQQFADPRIRLASHGLLAANGHNMQPWKIRLDKQNPMAFYLYADSDRLTKEVDPFARQTMISQGTFLEYVRVAGNKLGYKTNIVLFPNGSYDEQKLTNSMKNKPVAKITLTKIDTQSSPLYNFMFLPDTNRAAYQPIQLTSEQLNRLQAINTDEDIVIRIFQSNNDIKKLGDFALKGAEIESGIHRINKESADIFRANEYQKNKYRFGFSVEGQGTSGIMKHVMQGNIDMPEEVLSSYLDIVLAGFHDGTGYNGTTIEENTNA
ncbi:MAG TPA: hypothetical protein VHQ70_04420, partial [Syntrophomonadaceae bacterium]|nr:hypothetical protein [Syntrophomonadaceae bacterium]